MKKRLTLEELELQLPIIQLQETRFLLGGTGYSVDGHQSNHQIHIEAVGDGNNPSEGEGNGDGDQGAPVDDDPYNGDTDEEDNGVNEDNEDNGEGEADNDGYGDDDGGNEQDDYGDNDPEEGNGEGEPFSPGGGGWSNPPSETTGPGGYINLPQSLSDGINLDSIDWDISEDVQNDPVGEALITQIDEILGSNSVIADLINKIRANGGDITFSISDLVDPTGGDLQGQTVPNLISGQNTITLDLSNADINGWNTNTNANGTGTTNHDTSQESLVNTIVHELNHALINTMYTNARNTAIYEAQQNGLNSFPHNAVYNTLTTLYGTEVANIFYTLDSSGNAIDNSEDVRSQGHHDYMYENDSDYNQYLSTALDEWLDDVSDFEQYIDYLNSQSDDSYNDYPGPGSQEGP